MSVKDVFAMPTAIKITGRISSITNAFVNAVIPSIKPSEHEVSEALGILGLDPAHLTCAYCGDRSTEWDHLRPLVKSKWPTGYISEIANLVPSCGKCNQSKGAQHWRTWISSAARHSPASRDIPDLSARIGRLDAFERWREPVKIDFKACVPPDLWARHWANHEQLLRNMKDFQAVADEVKTSIANSPSPRKSEVI